MFVLVNFDSDNGLNYIDKFDTHKEAYCEILHDIEQMYDCRIDTDGYPFVAGKGAGKEIEPDDESCVEAAYLYKDRVNVYTPWGYADYLIIEV